MYYIYIVRCRGGSLYTDIEKRMRQHLARGAACAKYTRAHPVEALEALWQAEDHAAAARLEALIKTLPHEKKLALIADPRLLPALFGAHLREAVYTPMPPVCDCIGAEPVIK